MSYNFPVQSDSLCYSFNYNVLKLSHNRKLEKKAEKHNIKIVAAEITNRTNKTLNLGKDVLLKSGNCLIGLLSPEAVGRQIHRVVPPYMTYFMLYMYQQEINCEENNREMYPIGLPIAIGKLMLMSNSNKRFLNELRKYNFYSTVLKPGEKKSVLLGFYSDNEAPLSIEIADTTCADNNYPDYFLKR